MSKKQDKKELLNIITKPQKKRERVWLATVTLIVSLFGLFIAWWFWNAIIQGTDRPTYDIIGYAAPIGLAIASFGGLIASLQIAKRQPAVVSTIWTAATVGSISFIGVAINSVVAFVRYNDVNWLQSIGQAFRDFSVIEVGSIGLSIPTIITIAIIVGIIITDTLKDKK